MNLWKTWLLKRKARCFASGIMKCEQCGTRLDLRGLEPLKMIQCYKCGFPNFIPFHIAGFWLFQPLGGGGMGTVYKAYSESTRSFMAVKVLKKQEQEANPGAVDEFLHEIDIMKSIKPHPNIVRMLSCGSSGDDFYYLATEFVDGERLDHRVSRLEVLPERDVLRLMLELISAEKHIYSSGYLYRDMKPQNVMIRESGESILVDLGLCMPVDQASQDSDAEFFEGSSFYMPPERILGLGEGPFSEIYSLGMVMYFALTGQNFFKFSGKEEALTRKHLSSVRIAVTPQWLPNCGAPMVDIINRMISKERESRYQTFEEVERDLAVYMRQRYPRG